MFASQADGATVLLLYFQPDQLDVLFVFVGQGRFTEREVVVENAKMGRSAAVDAWDAEQNGFPASRVPSFLSQETSRWFTEAIAAADWCIPCVASRPPAGAKALPNPFRVLIGDDGRRVMLLRPASPTAEGRQPWEGDSEPLERSGRPERDFGERGSQVVFVLRADVDAESVFDALMLERFPLYDAALLDGTPEGTEGWASLHLHAPPVILDRLTSWIATHPAVKEWKVFVR